MAKGRGEIYPFGSMSDEQFKRIMYRESRKASASEHDLQVSCVRWFRLEFPEYASLLMAIPNGGRRDYVAAAKLKAEGVVPGVPDLFLAVPSGGWHGLWVEMKNGKAGEVSPAQREMHEKLRAQGYAVDVCRTFEDFVMTLRDYLRCGR